MSMPPPHPGYKLPKPYYDDGRGIVIYHGDYRQIVPMLGKFDLLLTDPPYGIGESSGRNKSRGKIAVAKDYGNDNWDNSPPTKDELDYLISCATNAVLFGGNYFGLPASPSWFIWDKDNGALDFADCEMAWTNFKTASRLIRWRWAGMLQQNSKEKEFREHPTQKPEPVTRWCIEKSIKSVGEIKTILDPFAGSGTTGRASKNMKLSCTMIEREEKYCEIAARRMQQEVLL